MQATVSCSKIPFEYFPADNEESCKRPQDKRSITFTRNEYLEKKSPARRSRQSTRIHFDDARSSANDKLSSGSSIDVPANSLKLEVEVTIRPTVSRPVRLGVLPLLEQVTRCYIYLSDNYFLDFSYRAPSLTRGRVCILQCNDASSISSYVTTHGLSASSSWCRGSNEAHNQILIYLFDSYFVFPV
jgi:hypothetical protein